MTEQSTGSPDDAAGLEEVSARARALETECAALRDALVQKSQLLRQLNHRMKNDLQVIVSLLNLQASQTGDPSVAMHLGKVANRIRTMALVHELTIGAADVTVVPMDTCLRKLLEQGFAGDLPVRVALDLDLARVEVPVSIAVDAGMLVNELVSNALQHAFPHGRGGRVRVGFTAGPDGMALEVADDGVGYDPSVAPSLGLILIRVLAKRLGAVTVETAVGTRLRVDLRVPSLP